MDGANQGGSGHISFTRNKAKYVTEMTTVVYYWMVVTISYSYIGGVVDNKTLLEQVDDTILDMLEEQEEQVGSSSSSSSLLVIVWIILFDIIFPALTF